MRPNQGIPSKPVRPRRILILLNTFLRDGPGLSVARMVRALPCREDFHFQVVALKDGGPLEADFTSLGIQTRCLRLHSLGGLPALARAGRVWEGEAPDVIHSHLPMPDAAARLLRPALGTPALVSTNHGLHAVWEKGILKGLAYSVLERATRGMVERFIAVSHALADEMKRAGYPAGRVIPIPNGVDANQFHPLSPPDRRARREELGIPPDTLLLLTCGNLRRVKGHTILLDALAQAGSALPPWKLAILGSGPELAHLEQQARSDLPAGSVRFEGHVESARSWYQAADLLVQPSLAESFGLSAAEASACGVPVVASAVGGLKELVAHEATGVLVRPLDSKALAGALTTLMNNPVRLAAMGIAARRRMQDRFSLEGSAWELAQVWHRVGETP